MSETATSPVLEDAALAVLELLPTPVSVFDRETLRILAVNSSTAQEVGRSVEELLRMTIADLRHPEDRQALKDALQDLLHPVTDAGQWRILRADGGTASVQACWRPVRFQGRDAVLATWNVISRYPSEIGGDISVGQERSVTPERAPAMARLYRALFESAPGRLLVIKPGNYEIVAASDAFLEANNVSREEITGRKLFDVFPADPSEPDADGPRNLEASLRRVERKREPDIMRVQRYPIRRRASEGGGFEERFWASVNAPVLDAEGQLAYLIHRTEDLTEIVQSGAEEALQSLEPGRRDLIREMLLRSHEFEVANARFHEQSARLRSAERLLDVGTWNFNIETRELEWSDQVREIYGLPPGRPVPDFDGYVAMVHPDDRDMMIAKALEFEDSDTTEFEFRHRIQRNDGQVVHVKGVGERHSVDGADHVVGFVQDITQYVAAMDRLEQATQLARIAGEKAKLGGWRLDSPSEKLSWTPGTFAIHELPEGEEPTLEEAANFYLSEDREKILDLVTACIEVGTPIDEVARIVTARDNQIWVRVIGEPVYSEAGEIVAIQGAFQDVTEIMEAKERFAAVSRQLRDTMENMGDAFYLIDRDWNFSFVNSEGGAQLERRREDLIGRNIWDEFSEAAETILKPEYERVREEGTPSRFVFFYPPLKKWFLVNAHAVPDGLAVYFNDVSEERARDEQLRLLEAAVSRLNDIVLITEADPIDAPGGPRVVYVNEAIEHTTGYCREEVLGRTPRFLQGDQTDRDELDRIRSALENWQPVSSEIVNYTKDGRPFWLELDIVPLADEEGKHTHFVAIQRDITERRQAQEAIQVRDDRFRLLSSATNDLIWDWDIVEDQVWWNDNLGTQFGYDREVLEPGFDSWRNRIHPDDRDRVSRKIEKALAGSAKGVTTEYRFLRADGSPCQVIDRASVIRDKAGKAVRMLGSIIDLTERRELEARYRQAQKLEAVGQLTGGVAHDFNNLLTIILGNADTLADSDLDAEQRLLADLLVKAAERGADLTDRLLAFSRRQALMPVRLDINRQLGEMEPLLRRTLREDVELRFVTLPELWQVEADPAQLESAIINLVINARDAMAEGGRLTVETANVMFDEAFTTRHADDVSTGSYVMISITDTGTGMTPETVEHAFEPFFTTKETGTGSGLGLSMVYGFAKQSGGHVDIYSEPGYGTTIKLYLPRSHADSEVFRPAKASEPIRGGQERILVVEDDDMVRSHLVSQLRGLGYQVESAGSGPEALKELRRGEVRYDLLLTDVIMPGGMNGRELAETAQAEMPGLRVLYTSGYTENTIIHNGRLDEGVHLLAKPYRRETLAKKVRLVLDETP